jgi:hypothetical protein
MKQSLFIFLILTFQSIMFSQVTQDWTKLFGGAGIDNCYSAVKTIDGNIVVVGRIYSEIQQRDNYLIMKLDKNGNELYRKTSNNSMNDEIRTAIVDHQGNIVVAGCRGDAALLMKLNSSCDTLWTRQINKHPVYTDQFRAVREIIDSGYIMVGVANADMGGNSSVAKVWIVRTDYDGNILWSNEYSDGIANAVTISDNNEILAVGMSKLLKLNSHGDVLWEKILGGNYEYDLLSVQRTTDSCFILTGSAESCCYKDLCLIKIDDNGNKLWEKIYGGSWEEVGKDIIQTRDKGYIVLGKSPDTQIGGPYKIWLLKTNDIGDTLWTKKFIVSDYEFSYAYPESFFVSEDEIIVVGYATNSTPYYNCFASKFNISTSSVHNDRNITTNRFTLYQNYPNPFNPTTVIKFEVPTEGFVNLKIFNSLGQEIALLINSRLSRGEHSFTWNAANYPSGIYFYRLQNNSFVETRKIVLIR